ncbi:hypothetical protein [Rhodococcus sp. NPDC058521]|uniref:hypothetical protein n=1 Tax=Rhodococcus sp. NPDC058521 TaxID=3346536 RepID=UPI0036462190
MNTRTIRLGRTSQIAAAAVAVGASLLLAAPNASAVTAPTVEATALLNIPWGGTHGTSCGYEIAAEAGAVNEVVAFEVVGTAPAVPAATLPGGGTATAAGDVFTTTWTPSAVGTYDITAAAGGPATTVEVKNGFALGQFVCVVLP